MITQFNNFLKYLEKNESPERAIPLLNDFSIRFGQDLLRLRELLFSKSALEVRLRHIESECNVVKTVFVCKQILSRARQVRETEADDDTLTKRLRVGAQLLPPLQKAKMTLEPFFLRDPNMLGEILTEIGLIHLQLFQDFDEAEKTLKEAKKLDDFLDPDHPFSVWTSRASAGLRRIFSIRVNPPILDVKRVLLALTAKINKGERHFLEFILLMHPPKHSRWFVQEEWSSPLGDIDHILRMKLLKLYEMDGIEETKETKENLAYLKIANAIAEYLRSSIGSD